MEEKNRNFKKSGGKKTFKKLCIAIISLTVAFCSATSFFGCFTDNDTTSQGGIYNPENDGSQPSDPDNGDTSDPDDGNINDPDQDDTADNDQGNNTDIDQGNDTENNQGNGTDNEQDNNTDNEQGNNTDSDGNESEEITPSPEPEDPIKDYPPQTVAELFPNEQTATELELSRAQYWQSIVSDTLNDYLYEIMVSKTIRNYDLNNVDDAKWEIVDDGQGNIETIRMFSFYNNSETSRTYYVKNVAPITELNIQDLVEKNTEAIESAFDTNEFFGAKYITEYGFNYNPTIQETRSELRDAINEKLAADGIISPVDNNTISFIKDNGSTVDANLEGTARRIIILNLTDKGYTEFTVRIKENKANNNDETLIDNLENNKYYNMSGDYKTNSYSNNILQNQDLAQNDITS